MKRLTIHTLYVAGILLLAASCIRFEEATPQIGGGTTFTGVAESMGVGTKGELALYYDVLWTQGDKIYVTDGQTTDDIFILKEGENTYIGTFEGTKNISGAIEAFYPETLKTDDGYVWPALQTDGQMPPMYAKQNISGNGGSVVNFSGLGALLRIAFSTNVEGFMLKTITLQDAGKPLSGKFEVNADGQAVMLDEGNAGITLDLGEGVSLGMAAKYFNIAIPAGKYDNMTISFTTTNGFTCKKTSTTLPEIKRNSVNLISLASSDFRFNGGEDLLPGKFSIGPGPDGIAGTDDDLKVQFSRGNLRYIQESPGTWCFANYDQSVDPDRSKQSINEFSWGYGWWSTQVETGQTFLNWASDGKFVDWGTAFGDGTFWRTLNASEWDYLIHQRNKQKAVQTVEEQKRKFKDEFPGDFDTMMELFRMYEVYNVDDLLFAMYGTYDWDEAAEIALKDATDVEYEVTHSLVTYNGREGIILYPDDYEGNALRDGSVITDAEFPYGCVFIPSTYAYWTSDFNGYPFVFYITGENGYWTILMTAAQETRASQYRHPVRLVHDVTPITYTVTFDLGGHEGTPPQSITVKRNSKIQKPEDPTSEGYVFRGWGWDFDNDLVTENITLTARWTSDALPGEFSVSADRQVRFSPGNLYWNCALAQYGGQVFEFEEGQQSYSRNTTRQNSTHLVYYYWSDSQSNAVLQGLGSNHGSGDIVLFTNETATTPKPGLTVNGQTGVWRTLSGGYDGEWDYLLNKRTMNHVAFRYTNLSQGIVIENKTHKGLFIYPDNYNGNEIGQGGPDNWEDIKSAGIVYLPDVNYATAGWPPTLNTDKTYYWSSTPDGASYAYCISFAEGEVVTYSSLGATSVSLAALRLVRDVESENRVSGTEQYGVEDNNPWGSNN